MKKITQSATLFNVTLLVLLMVFFAACKEEETVAPNPPEEENALEQPFEDAILPPTTVLLNETSLESLSEFNEDGSLVFDESNSQLDTLEEGDVLIVGVTPATPYGALKKVTSISSAGNGIRVQTELTKITEAYQQASIHYEKTLTPEDVNMDSTFLAEGVTLGSANGRTQAQGLNLSIDKEIQVGQNETVKINGTVNVVPVTTFDMEIEYFELEHILFKVDIVENVEAEFTFSGTYPIERSFLLARFVGKTVAISGVVITPVFEVELNVNGEINVGVTAQFSQQGSIAAGVEYINDQWNVINDSPMSVEGGVLNPIANGQVRVGLEPGIEALLYGIVGFELEGIEAYLEANVDLFGSPCWEVTSGFGLQPTLEVESDFFDFDEELAFSLAFDFVGASFSGECGLNGTVTGSVKDAITNEPIADVKVTIIDENEIELFSVYTDVEGNYEVNLPPATYSLVFSRAGYLGEVMEGVAVVGSGIQYIEALLQIGESYDGIGAVAGTIVDATDGSGISGATVTFRRGLGNLSGEVVASTITGSGGYYQVDGLEAGNYTATIEAVGYISGVISVISIGGQTTFDQNGSLSLQLEAGVIRIVLSWGENPWDLDSHLTGPSEEGGRFHVFYNNKSPMGSDSFLDLDDIVSFGPETITISATRTGVYRYSVHDFTNRRTSSSNELGRSGARVQVFVGDLDVGAFNVPNQPGTLWTVFELEINENGEPDFTAINSMSYESDEDDIQRSLPTDKDLIQKLPEKE